MSNHKKGYVFALIATLLMAVVFVLGKVALAKLTPQFFVAWTFSIAALPLGIWSLIDGSWKEIPRCRREDWWPVVGFGLFSIIALYLIWLGVQHLDPTVAGFISRVQVLMAVFLGVVFLK
ncbi:DMT family transporter, partial [bacterium]|nr:DMT family transporter [bacterium]